MKVTTDQERTRHAKLLEKRKANRIRSSTRRRRLREGRVPVLIEIDEVSVAERFKLLGEPDRHALQKAVQAFFDREINHVTA
jgi:hypothetical protein